MNVLHIEDQQDFVDKVAKLPHGNCDLALLTLQDVGVASDGLLSGDGAIEERLVKHVRDYETAKGLIDLVLLDTDLAKFTNGLSQSACRSAFQSLGIPVCRYSRKHRGTAISHARRISTIASEGSTSILVPDAVIEDLDGLLPWLSMIGTGFATLRQATQEVPNARHIGAAALLANILGKPDAKYDFFGYTSQNLFFFGDQLNEDSVTDVVGASSRLATQLGYWLYNYILTFPGPILNTNAAAAFLNLKSDAMERADVKSAITSARYEGPFATLDAYYWLANLEVLVVGWDTPLHERPDLAPFVLDDTANGQSGFYCMLTGQPIRLGDAASAPDWIPSGARLARVDKEKYEQLGPLLSI